jgi:serine/threonine protein kinase
VISDAVLAHLQEVADEPDLSATRYEILGTLGRGGMGTVYLARDRDLAREVALKVVQLADGGAERLVREARILARLEHPGIVPVHDVGTLPDGRVYYAMKRVLGQRLDEVARTASLAERLRVFERILETVAFAHAHRVVHRDLKPDNVMVGPFGEVLVLDWGVAKTPHPLAPSPSPPNPHPNPSPSGRGAPHAPATADGTVVGTPGYMAPEQERGEVERVDARSDVWALGAILAFLLAGEGNVARPLAAMRARAMADDPAQRYQSVPELAEDLRRYLAGLPVGAYRESVWEKAARLFARYKTPILLVLAYLLMRALLLVFFRR